MRPAPPRPGAQAQQRSSAAVRRQQQHGSAARVGRRRPSGAAAARMTASRLEKLRFKRVTDRRLDARAPAPQRPSGAARECDQRLTCAGGWQDQEGCAPLGGCRWTWREMVLRKCTGGGPRGTMAGPAQTDRHNETMDWMDARAMKRMAAPGAGKHVSMDETSDATKFRGLQTRMDRMKTYDLYTSKQLKTRETDARRRGKWNSRV
jgi:hypothetical protein